MGLVCIFLSDACSPCVRSSCINPIHIGSKVDCFDLNDCWAITSDSTVLSKLRRGQWIVVNEQVRDDGILSAEGTPGSKLMGLGTFVIFEVWVRDPTVEQVGCRCGTVHYAKGGSYLLVKRETISKKDISFPDGISFDVFIVPTRLHFLSSP